VWKSKGEGNVEQSDREFGKGVDLREEPGRRLGWGGATRLD